MLTGRDETKDIQNIYVALVERKEFVEINITSSVFLKFLTEMSYFAETIGYKCNLFEVMSYLQLKYSNSGLHFVSIEVHK